MSNLTASQRASLFAQSTRQNMHMLPKQSTQVGATTLQFNFPKARLLSSVLINCKLKVKCTGTDYAGTFNKERLYKIIRRFSLDLNNGFSPYVIDGANLHLLNLLRGNKGLDTIPSADTKIGLNGTADGKENVYSFALEMPITLNDRDAVGLVLLQNDQTNVTLTVDVANISDVFGTLEDATIDFVELTIEPMITTFSVPASADAFPDLSVLKLTNSRNDSFVGSGQHIIRLSTGTIYRRMLFKLVNEDGTPMNADDITSNIDLVFNQADVNYSISPEMLRTLNRIQFGYDLPQGVFAFDFSYQGIANLGGTRDFIDTERLTEFWLRFNTKGSGRCEIVTECLARLQ